MVARSGSNGLSCCYYYYYYYYYRTSHSQEMDQHTRQFITRSTPPPHKTPGRLASGRQGSPNPQALEYPNVSALHNSHSHAPRDAKYVVPARYGASLHQITVPSLNTKKTLPLYTLCSETMVQSSPSQQVNLAAQHTIYQRRGSAVPYGPKQMGNLTASPKFPITLIDNTWVCTYKIHKYIKLVCNIKYMLHS